MRATTSLVRYESQPALQAKRNAAIAKAYALGLTQSEIATIANVTTSRVQQIIAMRRAIQRSAS